MKKVASLWEIYVLNLLLKANMSLILSTLCRTHAERKPPEGFLPIESPLTASLNRYYEPWETITANLPSLISSRVLRDSVDCMPILSVLHLQAEPEWRRAYVLLTFMLHGYIWGCPNPVEVTNSRYFGHSRLPMDES